MAKMFTRFLLWMFWVFCARHGQSSVHSAFVCEEVQDPNVETTDIILPPSTTLPADSKGRHCSSQLFKPSTPGTSGQHHLIAFTPISTAFNNASDAVRRMLLFGCGVEISDGVTVTKDCEDISDQPSCHLIGAWSPGYHGDCFYPNTGIRMGTGGYAVFVLEVQWYNPSPKEVVLGKAGFTLYHTSKSGLQDIAMLELGNEYVLIPPHTATTDVTSTCTSTCTSSVFSGEVFVTAAISRMNFMGTQQEVSVIRDGQFLQHIFVTNLTTETGGRQFNFKDPIILQPGDVLETKCQYSSLNTARTTFSSSGALSDSELCLAYLRYHSSSNTSSSFSSCVSWRSLLSCDPGSEGGCTAKEREKFRSENLPMTRSYNDVIGKCPVFGVCTAECKTAIMAAKEREACMSHEDGWARVKITILAHSLFGRHFLSALASCELDIYEDALAAAERDRAKGGNQRLGHEGRNDAHRPALLARRPKQECKNRGSFVEPRLIPFVVFLFVSSLLR